VPSELFWLKWCVIDDDGTVREGGDGVDDAICYEEDDHRRCDARVRVAGGGGSGV
jgi:hypothetical protein